MIPSANHVRFGTDSPLACACNKPGKAEIDLHAAASASQQAILVTDRLVCAMRKAHYGLNA